MATNTSHSDHYNKNIFSLYPVSFTEMSEALARAISSSVQFNIVLSNTFSESYPIYFNTISEYDKSWKDLSELDKILRSRFQKAFDEKFREEAFVNTLSNTIANYSQLAKITGLGKLYKYFSNRSAVWNNDFIEPIRDTIGRTPSEKICEIEKYSVFHYKRHSDENTSYEAVSSAGRNNTPLLIIYAFINRHYILDLLPEVSVIRSLLDQGLDIFAADWGTPSAYDRSMTLGQFVNRYLDKSIDFIRKITKSEKVSLFGYCWGGDLALMYSAVHPEKVKNLITIATPGDFDLDDSLLATWAKAIKVNYLLDAFGNLPGAVLNAAFILRNPIEYSHKYFHFFEQPRSLEAVTEFFATETWLYDSPPIIGEIYRQFTEYCYKQNLLIKNKMRIEDGYNGTNDGTVINLKNINMPFLNILAKKDDLVAPNSSKALNDALTESHDKSLIELDSGHVGLMIGKNAHKELWPKVGEWLKKVLILLLEDCILIQGQTDRYGKNITCTIIFTFSGGTNNKMSLQISRIKGIPIRLHFTLIVVFFLITWTLATNFMPQRNSPNVLDSINYWIMGATGALILFVSVLLHELAHSLVAIKYGLKVRQIVLFIFGGVSDIEEEEKITKDFRKEFKIAVVGPVTSFGLAATLGSIWWVIFLQVNIEIVGRISDPNIAIPLMAEGILFYGAIANLLLGAFNLIPAFPLDGGRILRAALVGWKKDYIQATRIAVKLGIWISYGFMGAGFLIVLGGSFTGGIWLILIGWFLNNGAQSYLYQSEMSSTLSATSLKDIMNTNIIFIEQGTKVDEALSGYFHLYMKSAFPVLRTKNNSTDNLLVHHFFVGMVTLKQALDISEEKRHQISVEDIMTPRDRLIVMETNRKADEALMQMTQRRMGKVFVCNKEGQLIGLITKTDIMNVVDERMEFKETLAK